MDDQNKGVKERWAPPSDTPERGYAEGERPRARTMGEIRSDIERTRADMGETIDEIEDRLRPSNIASRAAESAREATVGRVREMTQGAREAIGRASERFERGGSGSYGFVDRIREHPVPAALAAASIAWLAFSGRREGRGSDRAIYGSTTAREPYIRETRMREEAGLTEEREGTTGRVIRSATDRMRGATDRMRGAAEEATARMRGATDRMRGAAEGATARMSESAGQAGEEMRRTTRRAAGRLERLVRENPLAVGAFAMAAGAAVGLIVPETRREDELMGGTRDTLLEKAKDTAIEAKERVQQAAGRAQEAAQKAVTDTLVGESKS